MKIKRSMLDYKRVLYFMLSLLLLVCSSNEAQIRSSIALKHGAHHIGKRQDEAMQQWRAYGLGQFIHWGVYAMAGGEWKGKKYDGAAEWIRTWDGISHSEYDHLYQQFDPLKFDAHAWANMAKNMGAKYLIITTKHHDGFCLWPSKYTDYTIANTPYKKDIVKQLVDAYTSAGIDVYLYFSIIDWHEAGYCTAIKTEQDRVGYEKFKTFTRNQLLELVNNYPKAKGIWFDGTWDESWKEQAAFADSLDASMRALHPGFIIGSRFRPDDFGKRHFDSNGDLMGDYEQGWERDLPNSMDDVHGNDWDCVMTIPDNQWGYCKDWKGYIKTPYNLIEMLVRSVSMDGNFVLNFGPDAQGTFRKEERLIAAKIGDWMKINHEAIYQCGAVDFKPQGWGYYTGKENKVYLSVFNRPINNELSIEIPRGGLQPTRAYFLVDGKAVKLKSIGQNKHGNGLYVVEIPRDYESTQPFVIVLEVDVNPGSKDKYQQART